MSHIHYSYIEIFCITSSVITAVITAVITDWIDLFNLSIQIIFVIIDILLENTNDHMINDSSRINYPQLIYR
jgi:hypothetical protein